MRQQSFERWGVGMARTKTIVGALKSTPES